MYILTVQKENPGYAYVSYHRSSEHSILMDMLTTRKEAKLLPSDTFSELKKLSKGRGRTRKNPLDLPVRGDLLHRF